MCNIIEPETPSIMLNFQMGHPFCVLLSKRSGMKVFDVLILLQNNVKILSIE